MNFYRDRNEDRRTVPLSSAAIVLSAALLCGCSNSGVKPANALADVTPTPAAAESTGTTTPAESTAGSVTVDLGTAADTETLTINGSDDLSFLTGFPYDTGSKQEYTVTETISTKASSFDQMTGFDETQAILLNLNGNTMEITTGADASNEAKETYIAEAVTIDGNRICITKSGTYIVRGTLSGGQICFRGGADDKIQLVLDGADLSCTTASPLYFESGDKALITIAPDSENHINSGTDSSDKGCITSNIDLSINGSGSLSVTAAKGNGIHCKDDLKILGGEITIQAENNALKGNDSVVILGGSLTLSCKGDGIKSDQEDDSTKGFVYIAGGTLDIAADDDGIQATTAIVTTDDASLNIRCYDHAYKCDGIVETAAP